MPIHDYKCKQCNRRSTHFFRAFSDVKQPKCPHCDSPDVVRLLSTFAVHEPWHTGMNVPSQETLSDFDENDADSMAGWVKGMRRDMGDDFGHDMDEFITEARDADDSNELDF